MPTRVALVAARLGTLGSAAAARRILLLPSSSSVAQPRTAGHRRYDRRPFSVAAAHRQASAAPASPATASRQPATDGRSSTGASRASGSGSANKAKAHRLEAGPTARYDYLVQSGVLRDDDFQRSIVKILQRLHDELRTYESPTLAPALKEDGAGGGFWGKLFGGGAKEEKQSLEDVPKGLYLFGDVGTGKSMLMDLFYDTLPSRFSSDPASLRTPTSLAKRRVHFHAFMIDVHKRMHRIKSLNPSLPDPIEPVARELAMEARVLCFDEFQVTDIADAMILRQLLGKLIENGVVFVMTSNRHPDDLYKNGIQRSSFIPCIELIKERFLVTDLDSKTDYRKMPRALSKVYFSPLNDDTEREVNKIFKALTASESEERVDPVVENRELDTWGRTLTVPLSNSKVAKFRFDQLCGQPTSAVDFIELTKTYGTIFVTDVPRMGLDQREWARRFITFIDACYESKTKLIITSEVPILQIFSDATGHANAASGGGEGYSAHMRSMMDDLGLSADDLGGNPIFTGDEELFAFARVISRLTQMGTREWAETAGRQ